MQHIWEAREEIQYFHQWYESQKCIHCAAEGQNGWEILGNIIHLCWSERRWKQNKYVDSGHKNNETLRMEFDII